MLDVMARTRTSADIFWPLVETAHAFPSVSLERLWPAGGVTGGIAAAMLNGVKRGQGLAPVSHAGDYPELQGKIDPEIWSRDRV
ncbi:hypothetical protein [Mesorhizobium abyssinicae]|uniref:hypothetical protein n=1 Tax=Mesorhizobium abyssinicae TaxID=1209958 RepID=UPI003CF72CD6